MSQVSELPLQVGELRIGKALKVETQGAPGNTASDENSLPLPAGLQSSGSPSSSQSEGAKKMPRLPAAVTLRKLKDQRQRRVLAAVPMERADASPIFRKDESTSVTKHPWNKKKELKDAAVTGLKKTPPTAWKEYRHSAPTKEDSPTSASKEEPLRHPAPIKEEPPTSASEEEPHQHPTPPKEEQPTSADKEEPSSFASDELLEESRIELATFAKYSWLGDAVAAALQQEESAAFGDETPCSLNLRQQGADTMESLDHCSGEFQPAELLKENLHHYFKRLRSKDECSSQQAALRGILNDFQMPRGVDAANVDSYSSYSKPMPKQSSFQQAIPKTRRMLTTGWQIAEADDPPQRLQDEEGIENTMSEADEWLSLLGLKAAQGESSPTTSESDAPETNRHNKIRRILDLCSLVVSDPDSPLDLLPWNTATAEDSNLPSEEDNVQNTNTNLAWMDSDWTSSLIAL